MYQVDYCVRQAFDCRIRIDEFMNNLMSIFEKQGGFKLIKRYWQSGAFFTAVGEFLLLGKSRTALEILRLATHLKAKQKLKKQYIGVLKEFDNNYKAELPHEQSNKVWVCWFQGVENAPELVQKCYHSLQENLKDKEIILITLENIMEYAQFPDFIIEKWKVGQISYTHMTDLLRLELLTRYGGLWVDSTVLCTSSNIPAFYYESDLFFYQCLKPGRDGHSHITSSWLISAKTNNKILMAVKHLCYKYWETHNTLIDYFLLHDFIAIVLEFYPEDFNRIIPKDNATPHILLLRLFEQYDKEMFELITEQSPFHKLSYKFTEAQMRQKGTNYDFLFGRIEA